MSETHEELLARAATILADRSPIYLRMREAEKERGFEVCLPGVVAWLPEDDWASSVVVSRDRDEVRLVAILAKRKGAFRRLLQALASHGLKPVVVGAMGPIMPAIMQHYGWKETIVGSGRDAEDQWRPQ